VSLPTRRPPARWNSEYARTVLDDLDDSGLTLSEFGRQRGIDTQRIRFWRKQLSHRPSPGGPRLVELVVARSPAAVLPACLVTPVRVQCPTGHVLEIADLPAEQALLAILRALQGLPC
jgi:transposase-like protein